MQRFDLGDVGTGSGSAGRGGSIRVRARMGSVSPKVLIGGAVALIGVGALAWSITSLQRPDRRPRIVMERPADANVERAAGSAQMPQIRTGGGGGGSPAGPGGVRMSMASYLAPMMVESYEFPRVKGVEDVRALWGSAGAGISSALGKSDDFAWMGSAQRDNLVEAVRLCVEPLATGTAEDFAAAVATLKGVDTAEPKPSKKLFDQVSPALSMSSIDVSNLRVSAIDTSEPSPMPRMAGSSVMSMRTRDTDGPLSRLTIIGIGTDTMFPDVSDFMGTKKRAVEVRVPVRTKGSSEKSGDLDLSLVMVWNEKARGWQPADYRMFVRNGEVGKALMPQRASAALGGEPTK
ncbi:MAG: hypothetical protein KF902_13120 [Phycisphaeraceae bacterium]|nr:hypothetical protein [Phycisphaeraceae bacterium]